MNRTQIWSQITHAVDWFSIKLTGVSMGMIFIKPTAVGVWIGIVAGASTIIYNSIRIYRELKRKGGRDVGENK